MAYNRNQKHKKDYHPNQGGKKRKFRKKLGRYEFYVEGCPSAVKVPNDSPETLERALKYLKRQMKDADTVAQFRARKEFVKPSVKKRKIKKEAIRNLAYKVKLEKKAMKNHIWTTIINGKAV